MFQVLAKQLIQDALKSDKHSRKLLMELLNQKDLLLSRKQLEEREPEVDSEHERELRNRFLNDLNQLHLTSLINGLLLWLYLFLIQFHF